MHKISNRIFEIFFKKTLDFLLAGFDLTDSIITLFYKNTKKNFEYSSVELELGFAILYI